MKFLDLFPTIQQGQFTAAFPAGFVGFVNQIGASDPNCQVYLDDESISEPIGTMSNPAVFTPPFIIKKTIKITTPSPDVTVYCDGEYYRDHLAPILIEQTNKIADTAAKISESVSQDVPTAGEVYDDSIPINGATVYVYDKDSEGTEVNWSSCTITNAGPGNLYFSVNRWIRPNAPMNVGATINIDTKKRITKLYFLSDAGSTTTVHLRAVR